MKESLLKLAECLAKNEEFAKKFSLLNSVDEQYEFAQKSVSGYTKEEFVNFLNELEKAYKLKQELSPEDIEKVSGGANVKTKAAAMAMLALSAAGSAAPMLTSASAYGSNFENYLREETENVDRDGVGARRGVENYDDDDDDDDVVDNDNVENVDMGGVAARRGVENHGDDEPEDEGEGVQQGPLTAEENDYERLTDDVVGNDRVKLTFDPEIVPPGFAKIALHSLDKQLGRNPDEGWAIVGDMLYYFFSKAGHNEYSIRKIIPLFYNESSKKACNSRNGQISVIKLPDHVNGRPVRSMGTYALERITELFPDLKCVILPRTLERITSDMTLYLKYSRPLKIYVPRGTNYSYTLNERGIPPLQPGLHVMPPQNKGISEDVLAIPPAEPWCTIM